MVYAMAKEDASISILLFNNLKFTVSKRQKKFWYRDLIRILFLILSIHKFSFLIKYRSGMIYDGHWVNDLWEG